MAKQSKAGAWYKPPRGSSVFATVMRFLVVAQVLSLTTGCVRNPSATFRNPKFSCPSSDIVEPVQQYPSAPQKKSVAEVKDFCARMKQHFIDSNIDNKEAEQFYASLKATNGKRLPDGYLLNLHNETYGMPGPEQPKPFVFEKQVMLKKITEEEYEIFYYWIGCGRNYNHMKIYLENGSITRVTMLEMWSESYPC